MNASDKDIGFLKAELTKGWTVLQLQQCLENGLKCPELWYTNDITKVTNV